LPSSSSDNNCDCDTICSAITVSTMTLCTMWHNYSNHNTNCSAIKSVARWLMSIRKITTIPLIIKAIISAKGGPDPLQGGTYTSTLHIAM
jgi:hypothetical protein